MIFKDLLLRLMSCFICLVSPYVVNGQANTYTKIDNGILWRPYDHTEQLKSLQVKFFNENIVHVIASPSEEITEDKSLNIISNGNAIDFNDELTEDTIVLRSKALIVKISNRTGTVKFLDINGKLLSGEIRDGRTFYQKMYDGEPSYHVQQYFTSAENEAYYGLGQHQQDLMNYKGRQVELLQYNTQVAVPFVVSSNNYGIYWNNASLTYAGDIRKKQELSALKLTSEKGEQGWLTAKYAKLAQPNTVIVERAESVINYSFLEDQHKFPEAFSLDKAVVTWTGSIASNSSGNHQLFTKFGGAIKIWLDGKLIADRWRKAWNPATIILDLQLEKGKNYPFKIEWLPEGKESYIDIKTLSPDDFAQQKTFAFDSEAADAIDYYFIAGKNADEIISGYRTLTGKAVMMPKWAMGFWQSRERYKTQQEILDVVKEFRKRKMPLDNIVLDWSYWKEDGWGSQDFDLSRFPDAAAMTKELHQQHVKLMISVWPKFYEGTQVYKDFDAKGYLYKRNIADGRKDWIGKGYTSTFYDPFNPEARTAFWNLLNKKIYSKGIDAWWLDATEPDMHSNISVEQRKEVMNPTFLGSSTKYFNAFPLVNAKGVYEGQRNVNPNERVFILTRSAFSGLQKYAAATWSGDIGARWEDMKAQISAGINFSLSGMPFWTMDIGGFVVEERYEKHQPAHQEEWREMLSRWFQFGAFTSLFRAHGQYPYREFYNVAPEDHPAYKSMMYYNKLRYRLLPYIYTLNGKAFHEDYTIMRGLLMDFSNDDKVKNIGDAYLFGPSLLVNPVYQFKERSRDVYLPAGQGWYDLYSGKFFTGGQQIVAKADYERMPVFVKEGSILPIGPELQYTTEKPADKITLYVYAGKDASFTLYEDEGTNYNYEKGAYTHIRVDYNEAAKTLTIADREGSYKGMLNNREFNVIVVSPQKPAGVDRNNTGEKTIKYSGKKIKIQL
jgi:alpha-D-xyloside xylohydrolase